jgi:glycosyltransferase involved in cell wall biosynthesis/CDP-glycerol glycerophosphotransferase (TagB/SpsB family)
MRDARPMFSIVTAVYNVDAYLPEFIRSVEEQTFDLSQIEVIAVDDGSTDGSSAALTAWRERASLKVVVLDQENQGQAAARNLGLRHAIGEWVTFTDPDDMLTPGFFAAAAAFASEHPEVEALASNVVYLDEARGRIRNRHPRRGQFAKGTRVVDLQQEPNVFTGSATVALFRLDRIRAERLTFDAELRPNFEDAHFAARYLLTLDTPRVGILKDARYIYRRRLTVTSTMQRSFQHPGRYTTVLERGYLDLIETARRTTGGVPAWVQQLIIYDAAVYLIESDAATSRVAIPPALESSFHDLFGRILRSLDEDVVASHQVRTLTAEQEDVFKHAYRDPNWRPDGLTLTRFDVAMGLQRLEYRYRGTLPAESFVVDGRPVEPAFSKTRDLVYLNRTLLLERIVWVPAGRELAVSLDDQPVAVMRAIPTTVESRGPVKRRSKGRLAGLRRRVDVGRERLSLTGERTLARTIYRMRFRDAWVLMDRPYEAGDNAERLFEHLRRRRGDITAWLVLEQGSADWNRMEQSGERRLIAYGTFAWRMLMLNAAWLLSSRADEATASPVAMRALVARPTWKFGDLQHGVGRDDLSPILNRLEIDLLVVSTERELAAVGDDGSNYKITRKEVHNTGLPRFDRLLERAARSPQSKARLLLVAPTWRSWLVLPRRADARYPALRPEFWASDYARAWTDLLKSPEIAAAAEKHSWRVVFMPHPQLRAMTEEMVLPSHVQMPAITGSDAQDLYAQCGLLVTDYSSVAFDLAYLDRPVVYYQFDQDRMMAGEHVGRPGSFDYALDGFGPVVADHTAVVAAIVAAIEGEPGLDPTYADRAARAFPIRDGRCCERVAAAVEQLSRPWTPTTRVAVSP